MFSELMFGYAANVSNPFFFPTRALGSAGFWSCSDFACYKAQLRAPEALGGGGSLCDAEGKSVLVA